MEGKKTWDFYSFCKKALLYRVEYVPSCGVLQIFTNMFPTCTQMWGTCSKKSRKYCIFAKVAQSRPPKKKLRFDAITGQYPACGVILKKWSTFCNSREMQKCKKNMKQKKSSVFRTYPDCTSHLFSFSLQVHCHKEVFAFSSHTFFPLYFFSFSTSLLFVFL